MTLEDKKLLPVIGIIALTAIVSIQLWSFGKLAEGALNPLETLILAALLALFVYNFAKIYKRYLIFRYNVYFFICIPLLSAFGALLFHSQPLSLSIVAMRVNFYWLLYFVLHIFQVPVKYIIRLMVFIGCAWIFLTVIQQFTYPHYYFFSRDDADQSIFRAGVYRYMIHGQHYGLFVLFYFFYNFLITRKIINLPFVLAGLLGFYYYGTRQFALSALICMCISILFLKGKPKLIFFILLSFCLLTVIGLRDQLFGQYVQMTNEQLEYGDDVRLLSANFFLFEYWPNWIAKIIGNGTAYFSTHYGMEIAGINEYYHFYRSDVGIIGTYNEFGILYVLNIIAANFKALKTRYYDPHNKYLILFFFNTIFLLVLSVYYSNSSGIPFYCFIMYLVDKSYEEKLASETIVS